MNFELNLWVSSAKSVCCLMMLCHLTFVEITLHFNLMSSKHTHTHTHTLRRTTFSLKRHFFKLKTRLREKKNFYCYFGVEREIDTSVQLRRELKDKWLLLRLNPPGFTFPPSSHLLLSFKSAVARHLSAWWCWRSNGGIFFFFYFFFLKNEKAYPISRGGGERKLERTSFTASQLTFNCNNNNSVVYFIFY